MALNEYELEKAQSRLMEMGSCVASALERNQIPYSLALGTLLGAVRHGGFIPWDDDFDLWLFDDSYDQAVKILRDALPDDMFLEDTDSEPLYFHSWAHVKDCRSKAICDEFPQDSLYAHKGLSIDLYRLTRLSSSELCPFIIKENRAYVSRRSSLGLMGEEERREREARINREESEGRWELGGERRDVFGFSLFYRKKHIEIDEMLPLGTIGFEGRSFLCAADPDAILRGYYGDYWRLPEPSKRVSHYSSITFS